MVRGRGAAPPARSRRGPALIVAGLLALTGCAAGGPASAPFGGDAGDDAAPTGTALTASNGARVATSEWIPPSPRGVILALHGYGDYGDLTFRRAARAWSDRGIATIAMDQRGFGRNASRGYWPGAEGLIEDAVAATRQVRTRYPCLPLVLLGHSMGGGVAAAAAARDLDADAVVLAVPAIWGGSLLNPFYRLSAWLAAAVVPDMRFSGRGVIRIQPTDNIEAWRELGRDPLYLSPPSARELHGLVRLTDLAEAAAEDVAMPALLLLGARDQIVANDAARETFGRFAGDRTVIEYPDGWHLIFRDRQAARVWRDVADWVLATRGPACEARP